MPTNVIKPTKILGLYHISLGDSKKFIIGGMGFGSNPSPPEPPKPTGDSQGNYNKTAFPTDIVGGALTHIETTYDLKPPYDPDDYSPSTDSFFFVREDDTEAYISIVDTKIWVANSNGNPWYFVPVHQIVDSEDAVDPSYGKNIYGLMVNEVDYPFLVYHGRNYDGHSMPNIFPVKPNNGPNASITLVNADFMIGAVRRICSYQGSIVYGGYREMTAGGTAKGHYEHWIAFSQPVSSGSGHGLFKVSPSAAIQIGDDYNDPIMGLSVNSIETDSMGIKGQLVVFTRKKVVIYDGLPPVPENTSEVGEDEELGASFQTVGLENVGTYSGKAIARTPYGLVFLGSDRVVYILDSYGRPQSIGHSIEPGLKNLTNKQLELACAYYKDGFYKLFVPSGGRKFNDKQYWADLRYMSSEEFDRGVKWSGPHTDQFISDIAIGEDSQGKTRVIGASSVDGRLFKLEDETRATHPLMDKVHDSGNASDFDATAVPIKTRAVSPEIDMEDAHMDKNFVRVSWGAKADTDVDVTLTVNALSRDTQAGTLTISGETFTDTVTPYLGILQGGTPSTAGFTLGTDSLASEGSFEILEKKPSSRLRGRVFQFELTHSPNSGANVDGRVAYSDLEIGLDPISRR